MSNNLRDARPISPEDQGVAFLPNQINVVVGTAATLLTRPAGAKVLYVAVVNNIFWIKPGDYVARTFLAAAVTVGTDRITIAAHGFETGDGPYKMTSGTTLPEPFASAPNTLVWVRVISATVIELYESYNEAIDTLVTTGIVDLADQGVGTHSLPSGIPQAAATATDGYSSVQAERGTGSGQGVASSSAFRLSAPSKITVEGQDAAARLEYWWV